MTTLQDFDSKVDELRVIAESLAVSPTPAPACWPASIDCLAGTVPGLISIPAGDSEPTGKQGEPAYSRRLVNTPDGSIGIFGDSIIQATPENLIHPAAVNYALGGQSLRRMINALPGFSFMRTAGAGVILCGVNDLGNTGYYGPRDPAGQAVATVLGMYGNQLRNWLTGKWVICHLLPMTATAPDAAAYKAQVTAVNAGLANALAGCAAQIAFCPVPAALLDSAGYLKPEFAMSDGQHLNKAGSATYASYPKAALASLGV